MCCHLFPLDMHAPLWYYTGMVKTNKQRQFTAYLPPELVQRLREVAKRNHRSMNAELTMALEKHLDEQEKDKLA